ncbi:hypothetical protein [Enterovibrio coralii]|nr:hypothetical protein [Enterovibrio coralii]
MTNTKKALAILVAGGIAVSGYLIANQLSSNQLSSEKALASLTAERDDANLALAASREEILTLTAKLESQASDIDALNQTLVEKDKTSQSLQQELDAAKQASFVQAASFEAKISALDIRIEELKKRIVDADKLYAQRHLLTKKAGDLNELILKASHKAELSKAACEEFKQGNSWNWVSQADCDNFNKWRQEGQQLIVEFETNNQALDKVNRQIADFKIPQ